MDLVSFWAFTVYDGQTRSLLETDQKTAGIDSNNKNMKANADGSYTVYFGPKAPEGKADNWVQTMPGKSYFVFLRLYGPLEPWFNQDLEAERFREVGLKRDAAGSRAGQCAERVRTHTGTHDVSEQANCVETV